MFKKNYEAFFYYSFYRVRAVSDAEYEYRRVLSEYESDLRDYHPILSRVRRWREAKLATKQKALLEQNKYAPHQQVRQAVDLA